MVEYHVPNPNEFREAARREFGFLTAKYGFRERKAPFKYQNPFSMFFAASRTFVYVEGLSYGFALGVDLGRLSLFGGVKARFPLRTLVSLRHPALMEPRFGDTRGQLEEMKWAVSALQKCSEDFLKGDFTALPAVLTHQAQEEAVSREEYQNAELMRLSIQASEAFHAGDYRKVIEVLREHEKQLTKAQTMMLSLARKRLG